MTPVASVPWLPEFSHTVFASADPRLLSRFAKYHLENEALYERFRRRAVLMKKSGRKKYGAWVIMNVLRWEHDVQTQGADFKICNDFIALYARLLVVREPSFEGFFELRPMKSSRGSLPGVAA